MSSFVWKNSMLRETTLVVSYPFKYALQIIQTQYSNLLRPEVWLRFFGKKLAESLCMLLELLDW